MDKNIGELHLATYEWIIAKARANGIELDSGDVVYTGDGFTIDGMDAEEWLQAMID